MMIFMPKHDLTPKMVSPLWIIVPPILSYMALLFPDLIDNMRIFFDSPNAEGFTQIMDSSRAATLFWSNAAAFDLFVGRWIYFDSKKLKANQLIISLILSVTIAFGPIGYLLYFLFRSTKDKRFVCKTKN